MKNKKFSYSELEQRVLDLEQQIDLLNKKEVLQPIHELKFQMLYENSMDAIFLTSPDGKIYAANPVACEMFGMTEEELCSGGRNNILDTEDPRLFDAIDSINKNGSFYGELTCKRKDGSKFQCEFSSKIFGNHNGYKLASLTARNITERKKMEKAIFESEKKYRQLFENLTYGFGLHEVITNLNNEVVDFRFLEVNKDYESYTCIKITELVGKTLMEVNPESDSEMIKKYGQVALTGVPLNMEYYSKTFNKWTKVHAYSPQKGQFATIFEDITERKKTEQALKESEQRFKNLFEYSGTGTVIIDNNGTFLMINNNAANQFGLKPEEIIGKSLFDLLSKDVAQQYLEKNRALIESGGQREYEDTFIMQGKEVTFLISDTCLNDENGKVYAVQSSSIDITERKVLVQALKDSEEKFRLMLNNSSDIFVLMNEKAESTFISESIYNITGYTANELLGPLTNVIHPEDLPVIYAEWAKLMHNEETSKNIQYRYIHKQKGYVWLEAVAQNFLEHPSIRAVIVNARDITERKMLEQALNESEEKFSKAFYSNAAIMVLTHFEDGTFMDVNNAFLNEFGFTKEEVIGKKSTELNLFDEIDLRKKTLESARDLNSGISIEIKFRTKSGAIIVGLNSSQQIYVGNTHCLLTTIINITERRNAEQALKEKTDSLKLALKASKAGSWDWDMLNNKFNWSDEFVSLLKLPSNISYDIELARKLAHPDDIETTKKHIFESVKNKTEIAHDLRMVLHDNSIRWVRFLGKTYYDNNKPIRMVGLCMDITDRKNEQELIKAKERAEASEKKYSALVNEVNDGVFEMDTNGVFTFSNIAHARIYGLKVAEELIGKSMFDFMVPEKVDIFKSHATMVHQIGSSMPAHEIEIIRIDGTIAYLEPRPTLIVENGIAKGTRGIVRDITERKKAEATLAEHYLKFDIASEAAKMAWWEMDVKTGNVTFNKRKAEMIGFKPENFKHYTDYTKLLHPDDLDLAMNSMKHLLEGKSDKYEIEYRLLTKSGEYKWFYDIGYILKRDEKGIPLNVFGAELDITDRKENEIDLIKAKEKAEESDRLKSSFLQNMSHEVRTPLNSIVGFSRMASRPNLAPGKLKMYSEVIEANSEKLIDIITDVIEISQINSNQICIEIKEFELISYLNSVFVNFERKAKERNINLILNQQIQLKEFVISTDIEKFKRIIFHLMDNAIKFTSNGNVQLNCEIIQNNLQISVVDTGIGISEEMQKIIFEPFRQVETGIIRNYGGNGLGLAIVKSYTKLLNGSVLLKSEINKGTEVKISFPINNSELLLVPEKKDNKIYTVKSILIADDEYSNYQYLVELLNGIDLEIQYAANGKQAIDFCRDRKEIDLVLMDIKMPVLDGHSAAKLIKSFRPGLPIIAQTAFALESEIENFKDIFDDYITKPVSENDFKLKMNKYLKVNE